MTSKFTIEELKNKIDNFKNLKCKNCIFNTGVQCHGFGDYWAECKLLLKILANDDNDMTINNYNKRNNLIDINKKIDIWYSVINDERNCKFYELINKLNDDENIFI